MEAMTRARGWLLACVVGIAGALALAGILFAVMPTLTGLRGNWPATESLTIKLTGLPSGRAVAQLIWGGDLVESADLRLGNAYSFRVWPGRYTLRGRAELPVNDDEFCSRVIRIESGDSLRVTLNCFPTEPLGQGLTKT